MRSLLGPIFGKPTGLGSFGNMQDPAAGSFCVALPELLLCFLFLLEGKNTGWAQLPSRLSLVPQMRRITPCWGL